MKNIFTLLSISCFLLFTSCNQETFDIAEAPEQTREVLSLQALQEMAQAQLDQGDVVYWSKASDQEVWSAGMHADSIFSIGYQLPTSNKIEEQMHEIDITQEAWMAVRSQILEMALTAERANRKNDNLTAIDLQPMGEVNYFPQLSLQLTDPALIAQLRELPQVRYVEPLGFSLEDQYSNSRSGAGCSNSPSSLYSSDYTNINPSSNCKRPWNFPKHNIHTAWNNCNKGDNATVCIIDSGADYDQPNLGSEFDDGYSTNRWVQKISTLYTGWWIWRHLTSPDDDCGHGTSMAGFASAPRLGDGNSVGVAYKSNLLSIKAVEDVLISTSNERAGVRDALYTAGARSDVKVISMSIGTPFYSSTVADGIYYAYNNDKLIVCAAGTSFSWTTWFGVIFPASMNQTVAATGVKDQTSNSSCHNCHDGSKVDFVIIMERSYNSNRTSLSLAGYGNVPKYVGGSSCATAITAGIATMIRAEHTNLSRAQTLQKMKSASQYYPSRHSKYGWGRLDANQAVN